MTVVVAGFVFSIELFRAGCGRHWSGGRTHFLVFLFYLFVLLFGRPNFIFEMVLGLCCRLMGGVSAIFKWAILWGRFWSTCRFIRLLFAWFDCRLGRSRLGCDFLMISFNCCLFHSSMSQ